MSFKYIARKFAFIKFALAAFLLATSVAGHAATTCDMNGFNCYDDPIATQGGTSSRDSLTRKVTTTAGVINSLHEAIFKPLERFQASLAGGGTTLLFGLLMLHVIAGGVMLAAGSTDLFDLAIKGIKLSIVGSLAYSALVAQPWLGYVTGIGGSVTLPDAIMAGFYKLMSSAGGQLGWQAEGKGTGSFFSQTVSTMSNAIFKFVDMPVLNQEKGFWRQALSLLDPANLAAMLYWFVSVIVFVLSCAMLLFELIGAELTIKFAVAFTPLMVPWMLFKPMEFLFNSWLRMLLIGGLGFVVTILMVTGFAEFAGTAGTLVQQARDDSLWEGAGAAMVMLPVLLGSVIFFMLASKANSIASGLISGSGTDGISLNTIRHAMNSLNSAARAPAQLAGHSQNGLARVAAAPSAIAGAASAAASGAASAGRGLAGGFRSARAASLASGGQGGGLRSQLQAAGAGVKAGASAFAQSVGGSIQASRNTLTKAELSSPGGKAVSRMAKAMGKEGNMTPTMMKSAIAHSNKAFATARGEGQLGSHAKVAAQNAAGDWMKSVGKGPKPGTTTAAQASGASAQPYMGLRGANSQKSRLSKDT